jgi:hypothetical protein
VSELTVDPTDAPGEAHTGFDLDGLASGPMDPDGCGHEDYLSRLDPDQNHPAGCSPSAAGCRGGVDNQLPSIADTVERFTMTNPRLQIPQQINAHRVSLVVRVAGVDDFRNDDSVTLSIYAAYPTFSDDCSQVLPNRVYQVSRSSIRAGGTTLDEARFRFDGRITNGRLRVEAPRDSVLSFPLPGLSGPSGTVDLHTPRVRMDLSEQGGTNGNLGGWVAGSELVETLVALRPDQRTLIESSVGSFVDIRVGSDCGSNPRALGGVSLGIGIWMIPARVSETAPIAERRTPGTCGTTATMTDAGVRD